MNFVNRLIRSFLWARAHHYSSKDNFDQALSCIGAMERRQDLSPLERTFKASLLLRRRIFDEAKDLFLDVIEDTDDDDSENRRYLNAYSRSMVHAMCGNTKKKHASEQEASTIDCDPILRKWLPL